VLEKLFSSLGRLAGAPDPSSSSTAEAERRVWVRYPCKVQVNYQAPSTDEGETYAAQVIDISRGGIGLLVNEEFRTGQFLSVELPVPSPEGITCVLAYVLHATPRPDGRWLVGCSFSAELDDNDLAAFGARRLKPPQDDQRGWVRFPCPVHATYAAVREQEGEHRPARVVNVSPTGIGLEVEREMDVGTLLSVEMRGTGDAAALTMLASVVRITEQTDGKWTLGCNFIRELSEAEMVSLL
jgi:c-di-GMP-binding flagellar brake protein YcgR